MLYHLQIFKACIEQFIRDRPRQWASFAAFRATRVDVEHASVEYIVAATHRESWQQIGALLQSKADLSSFALELQKKMGLKYKTPPTPVNLSMAKNASPSGLATIMEQQQQQAQHDEAHTERKADKDWNVSVSPQDSDYAAISAMFEKYKSSG